MAKFVGQFVCLCLMLLSCGCTGMFGRQGAPPDPLFANRKPIETKAVIGPPVAVPYSEPATPVNPNVAGR